MAVSTFNSEQTVNSVIPKKKSKKNVGEARLQIIISRQSLERLDRLKDKIDAASRAEVMRLALSTLDHLINQIDEGNKILLQDQEGNTHEIIFMR